MTQLETMQHAKQYLDQLSNGTDPITQEPLKRDDPLATERLQKCFAYVSGILGQVIANGGKFWPATLAGSSHFPFQKRLSHRWPFLKPPFPLKPLRQM